MNTTNSSKRASRQKAPADIMSSTISLKRQCKTQMLQTVSQQSSHQKKKKKGVPCTLVRFVSCSICLEKTDGAFISQETFTLPISLLHFFFFVSVFFLASVAILSLSLFLLLFFPSVYFHSYPLFPRSLCGA